jgi:acyl transferase domain-containing protein
MTKQTAVVICPGRGVYNKPELGYLSRHHADLAPLFARFDAERKQLGQETLAALDGAASFSISTHTRGDNASGLIYSASLGDFLAIDRDKIEIVAVTGNSMGWYSALACGGALSPENGFKVVNMMGTLMQKSLIGGQLIYPFTADDWKAAPERKAELLALIAAINERHALTLSIDLGGMLVLAGDEAGLSAFQAAVPVVQERFPMRLSNHAAFHSHLQAPVAEEGRSQLPPSLFGQPSLPMIDGRGAIWWPGAADTEALWDYTLGHQVTETYDFTHAIRVAAREFAPDLFIVPGPGTTLGGAVAQSLIQANWLGLASKADFQARQASSPLLVAMGMEEQRRFVVQ